jgi:aspartate/tyrosine/aromatic aminotransferase
VNENMEIFVTQSYSKNFGLYGERIGALSVVNHDKATAEKVLSQLKAVIRPMYSSPQLHGARLVSTVLNDKTLAATWEKELKVMSDRIIAMRTSLVTALSATGCPTPSKHFRSLKYLLY